MKNVRGLIIELRKIADNYQREASIDKVRPNYYMLGKADGLRTAADRLMSLLE